MGNKGFIYLLLEVDHLGDEKHKVGITKNSVEKRLRALQTGNPNKISCLYSYESINYQKIERWLHAKYRMSQTLAENEWFKLTDEEVLSFMKTCRDFDEMIKSMIIGYY